MKSLMLVNDFVNDYLLTAPRIAGMVIIIIGISLALLAKRITRVAKKQYEVDNSDKTYVTLLTFGFVMILAGMIVCIF